MFLMDGCYHQFHLECFSKYAKKALLTKLPNGDFDEVRCRKCNSVVGANEIREFIGREALEKIRD